MYGIEPKTGYFENSDQRVQEANPNVKVKVSAPRNRTRPLVHRLGRTLQCVVLVPAENL